MALAELGDDIIVIDTDFSERELVRAVPGSTFNAETKKWRAPLSWGTCLALRGLFGYRLTVGPKLTDWSWQEVERRVRPSLEIRDATCWAGDVRLEQDLYPYQDVGAEWMVRAECGLLADDMGTGKTIETIRALRRLRDWYHRDPFPVCVICPNTVKEGWRSEWARWDPSVEVFVLRPPATLRRKTFEAAREAMSYGRPVALVLNYETVKIHSRLAPYGNIRLSIEEKQLKELNQIDWATVIVDEAHRMKDPTAKQTRACWRVLHSPTVRFRYALTGTPIANHMGDLWAIMHGIAPDDYPTKTEYIDRYAMMAWSPFGDLEVIGVRPDTATEFFSILNPRMRRMPKELVLPFLPKKVRPTPRWVEMGTKQKKAYDDIKKDHVTILDNGQMMVASNNLVANTRLLQFSSAYCLIDPDDQKVHLSEPSPKLDAMEEIIDELGGESVVIVAESRQLIDLAAARLEKRGTSFRLITGEVPEQERRVNINDFQAGRAQVMLMTIKAGGVGITLTKAGVIVFLQRSWSMVDNRQCEDRVHRIGSEVHDKILVIDMIARGTVEEQQIPTLHDKMRRLEEILRDREVFLRNGDAQSVERLDQEVAYIEQTPLWQGTEVAA